jgi:cAMP-specific phosphodiesterase 4
MDLIRIVFKIFERFQFMSTFHISAERLFGFLAKLISMSNKSIYTWKHGVDVCQFAAAYIVSAKLNAALIGDFELLAFLVAALCHDISHEEYADRSETSLAVPQSVLFRLPGALESETLQSLVETLSDPDIDLFIGLGDRDRQSMWTMITKHILATAMSAHFSVIDHVRRLLDDDGFDPVSEAEHRMLLLAVLLKCADLADVMRPLVGNRTLTADIAEEFLRGVEPRYLADYVFTKGGYIDREASLMTFLKNVCLPLAQLLARIIPQLKTVAQQVKDNIQKWARQTHQPVPQFDYER